MRKFWIPAILLLCVALMAACGQTTASPSDGSGEKTPGAVALLPPTAAAPAEPSDKEIVLLCRVIDEEDGVLLLAGQGDTAAEVYDLPVSSCEITVDGKSTQMVDLSVEEGTLVEVYYDGMVQESYPAQFANVFRLNLLTEGFDDLCSLYLDVLDDLWEEGGLTDAVEKLGVDLSQTRLLPAERSAVDIAFGRERGIFPLEGTLEELTEQGYITTTPLGGDAPEGAAFYEWKDGVLLSIREESTQSDLKFTAQKWRTSLGAYGLSGCKAKQDKTGHWGDYTVEAQFVS